MINNSVVAIATSLITVEYTGSIVEYYIITFQSYGTYVVTKMDIKCLHMHAACIYVL